MSSKNLKFDTLDALAEHVINMSLYSQKDRWIVRRDFHYEYVDAAAGEAWDDEGDELEGSAESVYN